MDDMLRSQTGTNMNLEEMLETILNRLSDLERKIDQGIARSHRKPIEDQLVEIENKITHSKNTPIEARLQRLEAALKESERIAGLRLYMDYAGMNGVPVETDCKKLDMSLVDTVYELELPRLKSVLERVMASTDSSITAGERGGPSELSTLANGHYRTMLKRYIFAGRMFCEGKKVFDACCGRGWGTYILSHYARELDAVDYDAELIEQCKAHWDSDKINWKYASVLEPDAFPENHFEVVTGMEIIEHFTKEDGERLFDNIQRVLKPGGAFVATSYFPDTRHQADNHATLNRPDHHFLWTKNELYQNLGKHFSSVEIIDSWMIVAKRK